MVKTITGGTKITYHADGPEGEAWEADFTPPFQKLDLMKGLEAELNVKLPDAATLHTPGQLLSFYRLALILTLSWWFQSSEDKEPWQTMTLISVSD